MESDKNKWHTDWACWICQECLLHRNCSSTENCLAASQISDSQICSGGSDGKKFTCNVGDLGLNSVCCEDTLEEGMTNLTSILVQFSSVTQSCPNLCNPMDCSTPGLPIHQELPDFTQSHVHWVSDAIQPPHPLSSPFPSAFNLSQKQGLFKSVSSTHQVAKVLEFQLQHQSFQWIFRTDFL